jgi:hypothetical protein
MGTERPPAAALTPSLRPRVSVLPAAASPSQRRRDPPPTPIRDDPPRTARDATPGGRRTPLAASRATADPTVHRALAVVVEPNRQLNSNQTPSSFDATLEPELNGNRDPSGFHASTAPRAGFRRIPLPLPPLRRPGAGGGLRIWRPEKRQDVRRYDTYPRRVGGCPQARHKAASRIPRREGSGPRARGGVLVGHGLSLSRSACLNRELLSIHMIAK